jgi:hypothetical protein
MGLKWPIKFSQYAARIALISRLTRELYPIDRLQHSKI